MVRDKFPSLFRIEQELASGDRWEFFYNGMECFVEQTKRGFFMGRVGTGPLLSDWDLKELYVKMCLNGRTWAEKYETIY